MTVTDTILLLILLCLAYIGITLKLIGASVERMAGVSHYQQKSQFKPDIRAFKAAKAPQAEQAKKPITNSDLVDITDIPEEDAIKALENWGIN